MQLLNSASTPSEDQTQGLKPEQVSVADNSSDGVNPQEPQSSTVSFDALSEEARKYLQGQGIQNLDAQAIEKLAAHNRSLQKVSAQAAGERAEQTPNVLDDFTKAAQALTQPEQTQTVQPNVAPLQVSEATIRSYLYTLSQQFPGASTKLSDGSLFAEMNDFGIPMEVVRPDGSRDLNVKAMEKLASQYDKLSKLEQTANAATAPSADDVPSVIPSDPGDGTYQKVEMNRNNAMIIIMSGDERNPQYAEAKQFLASGK
jgi:hypothetical protein